MLKRNQGTGSYPCPPQGWQLQIRFPAKYDPFNAPYFLMACTAYSEQVGVYLHAIGSNGEMLSL
jgi:hypothetical protein